ncbi:hypothetical protein AB0D10_24010 [Kitasatospora sp. NPDC048545]|uniref:hypothetical protein n=1 Tax=Kitasatospora sp. NPDC048545 TaxID=3157208 RepID=UPI0033FA24AB
MALPAALPGAPGEGRAEARGLLPVPSALREVLPDGGLRRGTAVSVAGGDTGLLLALAAGVRETEGGWAAAVGLPDLGLAAAEGYGLDLRRLLVADDPGPHWAEVVSVLAGAVELVMLRPDGPVPPKLAARLAAVLRRSGCVLLVAGSWPGAALRLGVRSGRWFGLGDGHGQLTGRQVEVVAEGRGSAVRGLTARLWLPDEHGAVRPLPERPFQERPFPERELPEHALRPRPDQLRPIKVGPSQVGPAEEQSQPVTEPVAARAAAVV